MELSQSVIGNGTQRLADYLQNVEKIHQISKDL
jgi:hypothetical protein